MLLTLLVTASMAQDDGSSTDGTTPSTLTPGAPAGSYALSGFENINPYNGGMNFHLPLHAVRGRGGAAFTMMLAIEQKWRVERFFGVQFPAYNWWEGITPGYGPGVLQMRQVAYTCQGTIDDKKKYVVPKDKEKKLLQENQKKGMTTEPDKVASKILVPNEKVREAIADAANRTKDPAGNDTKGGYHEEGLVSEPDGKGGDKITNGAPGAAADPTEKSEATMTLPPVSDVEGAVAAHAHPAGEGKPGEPAKVTLIGAGPPAFRQPPSPKDVSSALKNGTNIVVGVRDKTVYFYGPAGTNRGGCNCQAQMSLKNFLNLGKSK